MIGEIKKTVTTEGARVWKPFLARAGGRTSSTTVQPSNQITGSGTDNSGWKKIIIDIMKYILINYNSIIIIFNIIMMLLLRYKYYYTITISM